MKSITVRKSGNFILVNDALFEITSIMMLIWKDFIDTKDNTFQTHIYKLEVKTHTGDSVIVHQLPSTLKDMSKEKEEILNTILKELHP